MGTCASRSRDDIPTTAVRVTVLDRRTSFPCEPFLLKLHSAHNLPSLDVLSDSDVYCKAKIVQSRTRTVTGVARWPVKWDATNPLWDSCRLIGTAVPSSEDQLELQFWDADESFSKDDMIGTARCPVGNFVGTDELTLPITLTKQAKRAQRKGKPYCVVSRQSLEELKAAAKKSIFIVRHGESVWNKAQADKDVVSMLSTVDHPLNAAGKGQAEALQAAISEGVAASSPDAAALLAVDAVWCSPLTRAIQTCLIGTLPILEGPGSGAATGDSGDGSMPSGGATTTAGDGQHAPHRVLLNPNLREKRNFGGKDSSGKWCGEALRSGVRKEIEALYAGDEATASRLNRVELDLSDVQNQWWLGSKESEQAVAERMEELLCQIRFSPHGSLVLVGHSHYFREMCRRCRAPACTIHDAAGSAVDAADLEAKKLSNGGIAKLELDWSSTELTSGKVEAVQGGQPITSVQLMFGTALVK